jgi:hypothetical protein
VKPIYYSVLISTGVKKPHFLPFSGADNGTFPKRRAALPPFTGFFTPFSFPLQTVSYDGVAFTGQVYQFLERARALL